MFTPSRVPSKQGTSAGLAHLSGGGAVLKRTLANPAVLKRWAIRLLVLIVALYVLWKVFVVAVGIATNDMWFDSVHAGFVYHTIIWTRILLFVVFAVIGGAVGGVTFVALRRIPPLFLSSDDDTFRWTFRKYEPRFAKFLLVLAIVIPAVLVGRNAATNWQSALLWWNSTPFHAADPTFHKDISFFVEELPFYQAVMGVLLQAVSYGLWIAGAGGYWYGTWRLRRGRKKVTRGIIQLLSSLAAVYLVLKAVNYWLSRYSLTTSSRGPVTGAGYTDIHASMIGAYVLMGFAIAGAIALVASAALASRVRALLGVLVVMVIASAVFTTGIPGLVYHYREAPSAAKLDLDEIRHNQAATKTAFGLDGDIKTVSYNPSTADGSVLADQAFQTAQIPVTDPNQLSPTFNVEQQLQSYYNFKSTLDTGNYRIAGASQDVVSAVRELKTSGIPGNSWVNQHLVYTHGYGIVAAPTTAVDPKTESPAFLDAGIPPSQEIPISTPQVYFGQGFTSGYSIVGRPKGSTQNLEFDHPGGTNGTKSTRTTYTGNGGIPIGSAFKRLLFAVKLSDPNIFFSSEMNSASQLLMTRDPRTRVATIAPWLTLDGNVYAAAVDGRIKWIVDGYTTTSNYPDSQEVNLSTATRTTLTTNGATIAQPSTQVNYMHNSVKAVVDAYTGKVDLYEWNQKASPDPLLKAWENVFPGLVKPQTDISPSLVQAMRYPTDLFNVQRYLLAKYHVTSPASFYAGNDFWTVPTDPTVAATSSLNSSSSSSSSSGSGSSSGGSTAAQPARYISMSADGYGAQAYSLSSPMVNLNGHNLSAFVYVNSQPGPDYGKFTVLDFPSSTGGEAPSQVQNDIDSDTQITDTLTLQRGGTSSVVLGDMTAIPVGGKLLYVEPVYTQSNGSTSFPILRHVIALYGNGDPSFKDNLHDAVTAAIDPTSSPG